MIHLLLLLCLVVEPLYGSVASEQRGRERDSDESGQQSSAALPPLTPRLASDVHKTTFLLPLPLSLLLSSSSPSQLPIRFLTLSTISRCIRRVGKSTVAPAVATVGGALVHATSPSTAKGDTSAIAPSSTPPPSATPASLFASVLTHRDHADGLLGDEVGEELSGAPVRIVKRTSYTDGRSSTHLPSPTAPGGPRSPGIRPIRRRSRQLLDTFRIELDVDISRTDGLDDLDSASLSLVAQDCCTLTHGPPIPLGVGHKLAALLNKSASATAEQVERDGDPLAGIGLPVRQRVDAVYRGNGAGYSRSLEAVLEVTGPYAWFEAIDIRRGGVGSMDPEYVLGLRSTLGLVAVPHWDAAENEVLSESKLDLTATDTYLHTTTLTNALTFLIGTSSRDADVEVEFEYGSLNDALTGERPLAGALRFVLDRTVDGGGSQSVAFEHLMASFFHDLRKECVST